MAIPDWTVELLKRQINDIAVQLKNPESIHHLRQRAMEFLHDLPQTASRFWEQAREGRAFSSVPVYLSSASVLNASGNFCGGPVVGAPVRSSVIHAGVLDWNHFRLEQEHQSSIQHELSKFATQVGADDCLVSNGWDASCAAVAALATQRGGRLFLPRCCATKLPSGRLIPEALGAAADVVEVGAVDGVDAQQWQRLSLQSNDTIVFTDRIDQACLPGPNLGGLLVQLAPHATLHPLSGCNETPPSLSGLLSAGIQLVVTSAAGWLGGPACGLIFGPRSELQSLRECSLWPALQANVTVQSMATAALAERSPLHDFLEVSLENLQHRAQHLSTRLAACAPTEGGCIAECLITEEAARLAEGQPFWVPSRQLALRHATLAAKDWAASLLRQQPAVLADVQDDRLVVDLRWIDAGQDAALAQALGAKPEFLDEQDVP